jgi:hypothetical protein
MDTAERPWRISGVAGLLFVVASFAASAINVQPPRYNQDAPAIAAWFAENSPMYRVGHFVAGLAFLLFTCPSSLDCARGFALRKVLRRSGHA